MPTSIYFIAHITAIAFSYTVFFVTFLAAGLYLVQDYNLKGKHLGRVFNNLPDLEALDKIIYRSIALAFPVLTIAAACGFILNKDIAGSYFSASKREIHTIILWLIYAATLHVRLLSHIRGKKVAVLSILAFAVIIVSLFTTCGVPR